MATIVTGPADADILQLVSVAKLKESKRIVHAREDSFLSDCILDSWSWLDGPQGHCRRAILPQTWKFTARAFPAAGSGWRVPIVGAREVQSIQFFGLDGGPATTMSASAFGLEVDRDGLSSAVMFGPSFGTPALAARADAITVTFRAGWESVAAVPRVFRRALLLLAGHYYDNREATFGDSRVSQVSREIELGVDRLLEKWIVPIDVSGGYVGPGR